METAGQQRLGLLGWPVAHSLSPAMHNAALAALGLPWTYELLPTPPADLAAAVGRLRREGFVGANVTVPHKQAALALVDDLTPAARAIGAVNTLFWQAAQRAEHPIRSDDRTVLQYQASQQQASQHQALPYGAQQDWCLCGDNTDSVGFMADLAMHGLSVTGQAALVIGAGGAARAVVFGLVAAGATVTILNRTLAHAEDLAQMVSQHFPAAAVTCGSFPAGLAGAAAASQIIVNTTSVGMWPHVEAMPWDQALPLRPDQVVYDLVYRPRLTAFLRHAQAGGARVMDGLGMLVQQGAAALTRWTGRPAPVAVMTAAAEAAMTDH